MSAEPSPRSRKWLLVGTYYASDGVYLDDVIFQGTHNQCVDNMARFYPEYTSFYVMHESELEEEEDDL